MGIPAVYCEIVRGGVLDASVLERAAALTREQGSDAWYELPVERFLPEGLRLPGTARPRARSARRATSSTCGSTRARAHRADPGDASRAARDLAAGARRGGRVLYFEGPDQHRGWFNSSLMIGIGASGQRAVSPTCSPTAGCWTPTAGRCTSRSATSIAPETIIKQYGADIVRWWALATDWRSDVRVGDEILQRVADAYRKVRNTFRFLLGNVADFAAAPTRCHESA